jgi:hypothetical protein
MFSFAEGVSRWHNRVVAYALTLVTDQGPPAGTRSGSRVAPAVDRLIARAKEQGIRTGTSWAWTCS